MNNFDYKNMTPFKWFVLENFPFIENDFEAINNYHLFSKVVEYLNKTIDNVNVLGNLVEQFSDYFDNLDVQEEINNKLDEMVESGEFQEIIGAYINPYLTSFNDKLDEQDRKISAVESGSPLVASSTSGMTNTSKVYVNTSDGYWYYYNGENWVRGGVYQASQPSDELEKFGQYLPQFCRGIIYNKLYITADDTKLNVKASNSGQIWFIGNKPIPLVGSDIDIDFAYTDYNINAGIWALVVNQSREIKLKQINNNVLEPDDLIIMIFAQTNLFQYSLVTENLYYNNHKYFVDNSLTPFIPNMIIDTIYGRCEITIDNTGVNVDLIGNGQPKCFFITQNKLINTGNITEQSPASYEFPIDEYNINSGTWFIVLDSSDYKIKMISYNDTMYYNYIIIMIITNRNTRHITTSQSNIYLNGKDITQNSILTSIENIENEINNLELKTNFDFLRCFKNFTFIGDSLTAGYTSVDGHTIGSETAKQQNNNWCSYLCSRLNREFTNLGFGSSTIHNWRYADQQGQDTNIDLANLTTGIYFVGLGVNDLRQGLTVGTSEDINSSDYTQNANTVYGNYDYIINKLKSFNPYAKIFTFTIPNSETNPQAINNAIKYVSNLYDNVYCIDLYTLYNFNEGFIAENFTNGHYNPITYNYMSLLIERAVNNFILENPNEFDLVPYNYN